MRQPHTVLGAAVAALLLACSAPAAAGAEEGRAKAAACVACHGENGNSANPAFPSLSGQPKQFIVSSLFQFREGKRENEIGGCASRSCAAGW